MFQFPSNGKGGSKACKRLGEKVTELRFNSLQTGKGVASAAGVLDSDSATKFQFPSNGKGGSKMGIGKKVLLYAARFNSLQTGKGVASLIPGFSMSAVRRFNSLQTGKGVARNSISAVSHRHAVYKFQFPSNGKGGSKDVLEVYVGFEVNGSFNSLQTGKGVARQMPAGNVPSAHRVSIPFKRERG